MWHGVGDQAKDAAACADGLFSKPNVNLCFESDYNKVR